MKWMTIGLLAAFAGLWLWYPSLPKAYLYSSVRTVYSKFLDWKTSDWQVNNTSVASIRYSETDKETAQLVAQNATTAINLINNELDFKSHGKTLIIIYPDSLSLAKSFGWDSDAGAMGVYYGGVIRILSPTLWINPEEGDNFAQTFAKEGPILHEYVHLVVDNKTNGNYERWFTEGLAQYYEDKFLKNVNVNPVLKDPFPLSEMGSRFDYLRDQEWAYAQSYLMVKFLMESYGNAKMATFLKTLGTGMEFPTAFKKVYGITLEQFDKSFKATLEYQAIPA